MIRGRVAGRLRQPSAPLDQTLINYIALSKFSGDSWSRLPGAANNRHAVAARREAHYNSLIRRPVAQWLRAVPSPRDPVAGEVRRHARPIRPVS